MGTKLTDAELLRYLGAGEKTREPRDETDAKNQRKSLDTLSSIFALNQSTDFQWFESECLASLTEKAREAFIGPNVEPEQLPVAQKVFHAMLEVRTWLLEQEIVHRQAINPDDKEIPALTEQLSKIKK